MPRKTDKFEKIMTTGPRLWGGGGNSELVYVANEKCISCLIRSFEDRFSLNATKFNVFVQISVCDIEPTINHRISLSFSEEVERNKSQVYEDRRMTISSITVNILKFRTLVACQRRSRQTGQPQIRLLPLKKSDQGLPCLLF